MLKFSFAVRVTWGGHLKNNLYYCNYALFHLWIDGFQSEKELTQHIICICSICKEKTNCNCLFHM